jgi:peptidoglycan/LPS O-acetylase OafA/YrhL
VTGDGARAPAPVTHLHALDLLRGVAAVVVLVFHAYAVFGRQWAPGGYLAVDVFFVMSGCVLAHAYESRLRAGWGLRAFLWRRALRFWPLHALGLIVGVGAEAVARVVKGVPVAPGELAGWGALGAAFLPVVGAAFMFPLNSPGWSLLHELVVNGLYAGVAPWLRTRVLAGVCALAGVALGAVVVTHGKADVGVSLSEFVPAGTRTVYAFFVGVLLYRLWRRSARTAPDTVSARVRRWPLRAPPFVALAVVGVCFVAPVAGTARLVLDLLAVTLVFPLAVGTLLDARVGPRLARLGAWLGEASFAVYALHWPIVRLAGGVAQRVPVPRPVVGVALVVGVLVLATVVERRFDRPVRTWLARRASVGVSAARETTAR